ncbi:MAG: transcriptional repressor [Sciscionella sp.]|nr:transcriptional repressor [Sciscionella sp.]
MNTHQHPHAESSTTSTRRSAPLPGQRATRQRAALTVLLADLDEFRSAQELHEELRRRGEEIGLTTVYRTLQSLSDAGEVDVLRTASGESIYRRCSAHHHHHLVCRHCGRTVEVEGPAVEKWADRVAVENGFSELSHTVEIFGTCADCTDRPTADNASDIAKSSSDQCS